MKVEVTKTFCGQVVFYTDIVIEAGVDADNAEIKKLAKNLGFGYEYILVSGDVRIDLEAPMSAEEVAQEVAAAFH